MVKEINFKSSTYRIRLLIAGFYFGLISFLPSLSLAALIPTLLTPDNNSQLATIKFTWQTPNQSNQYRIIIDDSNPPTSPYIRDYYTSNDYYSPQLSPGTYYWRVKAKDSSNTWSDWSETWLFELTENNSSPTPQPTSQPTPTLSPSPTASTPTNSFTIENAPSSIRSDEALKVLTKLDLSQNPNTKFYLKGAFKKDGGSNYFGLTKVSDFWVSNGSSFPSQFPIITDSQSLWTGILEIKPDIDDSGFTGSGDYIFKVGRYNSTGSGPIWSDEKTIHITQVSTTTTSTSQNSKVNSPVPSPKLSSSSPPINSTNPSIVKAAIKKPVRESSIAGVTKQISSQAADFIKENSGSPSGEIKVKSGQSNKIIIFLGFGLVTISLLITVLNYLKRR